MNKKSNIVWGILFIIVGVIIGLNILEITNINLFFNGWWTLVIIILCLINIIKKQNIFVNIVGIIIGVILLLCCQNVLDFELVLKLSIPVLLIALGIQFILNSKENK